MPEKDKPADAPPDDKPAPVSGFSFDKLWIARFLFQEVPVPENESPDEEVKLRVGGGIGLFDHSAEVKLEFWITPNLRKKPYLIELAIVGRFSGKDVTKEQLVRFCQSNAPAIMFPYVRQSIQSITANGRAGAFHLPLMNMLGVFAPDEWAHVSEGEPTATPTAPSAS
jgi:preprotein translocase subunit SecB